MTNLRRRELLTGTALVLVGGSVARGRMIGATLPWQPDTDSVATAPAEAWQFFTAGEAAMVEALADRIIPADPETPGG